MLHLYDINHNKIKGLKKYKDYHIKSVLSTASKTLFFSYPLHLAKDIIEESYIRNKTDEFIVKEIVDSEKDWVTIIATLNVENLEGKAWKEFASKEQTIQDCLNLAFAGTGWSVKSSTVIKKRTIRMTNVSSWDVLQQALKTYRCEIILNSIDRDVIIKEKIGDDKGAYFIDSLNLINLNSQSNSYEFYTKMIALGKTTSVENEDGSTIENTVEVVVENHQYSDKVKTIIWKDERYTDEASLREDAGYKLYEISKPYKSYAVEIIDLANINEKYKDILSYSLGDTVTLISKIRDFKDKQRIVKIDEYPDEPERNTCELGNIKLTFDQVQMEQEEVSATVNNITSDNGTISLNAIKDALINYGGIINADEINAIKINVGELEATVAKINTAYIDKAYIDKLIANYATIENLESTLAKIGILEVDYAAIKELLAGNITSGNIQTGGITGDNLNMLTIFVNDANILNLSASKIDSGELNTNKVKICSESGNIEIADGTQQFRDENGIVRIQIGEDANGNFNFVIFDETGNGVLIDHTGVHEGAIADGFIKEDMIGNGQVGGSKINWSSFTSEFNKDTNTNTLLSSKILVDGTNQSALLHFNRIDSNVNGLTETVGSHTTQLNIEQGRIDTLIQDTTIIKDGETVKLKDEYNKTVNTVDTHTSTIARHESEIDDIDSAVLNTNIAVNEVKRDLESTTSTISNVSTDLQGVKDEFSTVKQSNSEVLLKVSSLEESIGNNIIENGDFTDNKVSWTDLSGGVLGDNDVVITNNKSWLRSVAGDGEINIKQIIQSNLNSSLKYGFQCKLANSVVTEDIWYRVRIYTIAQSGDTLIKENVATIKGSITNPYWVNFSLSDFELFDGCYVTIETFSQSVHYITDIKLLEPTVGNYASTSSVTDLALKVNGIDASVKKVSSDLGLTSTEVASLKLRADSIESTVASNKNATDKEISSIKQTASDIQSTVTSNKKDADGKMSTMQSSITQQANQIATKVDVNGVKSTIQQNPDSIKVGFNKINDKFEITQEKVSVKSSNGNSGLDFVDGSIKTYRSNDGALIGKLGTGLWQGTNNYGTSINSEYGCYVSLGYKKTPGDIPTSILCIAPVNLVSSGITYKVGTTISSNTHFNGYDIDDIGNLFCYDVRSRDSNSLGLNGKLVHCDGQVSSGTDTSKDLHIYSSIDMHYWRIRNAQLQGASYLSMSADINEEAIVPMSRSGINNEVELFINQTLDELVSTLGKSKTYSQEIEIQLPMQLRNIIDLDKGYEVFISKYGKGDIWISSKERYSFKVESENDIEFAYEIKGYKYHKAKEIVKSAQVSYQALYYKDDIENTKDGYTAIRNNANRENRTSYDNPL